MGDDPMAPEEYKRKLTAVLSADAVGYSRLMGADETERSRLSPHIGRSWLP